MGNEQTVGPCGRPLEQRPTVVSVTLDDGLSNQYAMRALLRHYALCATFYVNAGRVGTTSEYLSWDQLSDLAADGNEIAGHTLDHVKLTRVGAAEAQRQIGGGRRALIARGFSPHSFAYPFGAHDHRLEALVGACGYLSARRSWGLAPIGSRAHGDRAVPACETLPPENVWRIRTTPSIRTWHTLDHLKNVVMRAESGGGWLTLVLHHLGDGRHADAYSVTADLLERFLAWLAPRESGGTMVRTVGQVVSGAGVS